LDLGLAENIAGALKAPPASVLSVSASEFGSHKTDRLVFILGGQNSPEGVGEIVGEILSEEDKAYLLSSQDARRAFVFRDVWSAGQVVVVFAGYEREQTRQVLGETVYGLVENIGSVSGETLPLSYPHILSEGPFTEVDSFEANSIIQSVPGIVIIDVRSPPYYEEGRIPGAVNVPEENVSAMLGGFDKEKTYLLYCGGNSQSIRVGRVMHAVGFNKLYRLVGGYAAWRKAGYQKE
jgi:rhodanese-related sulfurtransferase